MIERKHNTGAHFVSVLTLAQRLSRIEAFQRGYASAMKNLPYDYDICTKEEAIPYLRGRAFAIWTRSRGWKACRWKNGVLSEAATQRLVDAMRAGAIL